MRANRPSRSAAFTLVELLVVIVIIAILAGLLLPAIGMARSAALRFRIATEMTDLTSAIDAYKLKYADYPPDFSDVDIVRRHILTAWPNIQSAELEGFIDNKAPQIDPAEALVFWLGGFSSNPKFPLTGDGGPFDTDSERSAGSFDFDKARFVDNDGDGFPEYPPPGKQRPYVYFDSRTYGGIGTATVPPVNGFYGRSDMGWAKPHLTDRVSAQSPYVPVDQRMGVNPGFVWANENTFQIISAGLDDNYGAGYFKDSLPSALSQPGLNRNVRQYPVYPLGLNYADASLSYGDDDNITNFSEGSELQDKKP